MNERWLFPLKYGSGIPIGSHPGAFGFERRNYGYIHPGVDLYTFDSHPVFAVEDGTVISVEAFTGAHAGSGWWNDTWAVLVEGDSGVVCYGEISPIAVAGTKLRQGDELGLVIPVLKEQAREDIPGHSCSMLHLELYAKGRNRALEEWALGDPQPDFLINPTLRLLDAMRAPSVLIMPTDSV